MNSTKTLEEVEGAQLGLGILRSLIGVDADEVQNSAVKEYMDGNMKLWQQRAGLGATGITAPKDDDNMGHTVAIGNTYYQVAPPAAAPVTEPTAVAEPPATPTPQAPAPEPVAPVTPATESSGLGKLGMAALVAAALGTGAAGTYFFTGGNDKPPPYTPPAYTDTDTDTSSKWELEAGDNTTK
jgi:hypothetical protein